MIPNLLEEEVENHNLRTEEISVSLLIDSAVLNADHQIVETSNRLVRQRHLSARLKDYVLDTNHIIQEEEIINSFLTCIL